MTDLTATARPPLTAGHLGADIRAFAVEAVRAAVVYAGATVVYAIALIALFQAGLFGSSQVLFFRGIAVMLLLTPAFALALAAMGQRTGLLSLRDAFGATLVAASLNFAVFALGPVTVDRSISIFINGHMAADPNRVFTSAEIDQAFRSRYLTGMDQITRRMEEQRVAGTVERVDAGYRITDKGRALIAQSRWMAALFQTDKRLLDGPAR